MRSQAPPLGCSVLSDQTCTLRGLRGRPPAPRRRWMPQGLAASPVPPLPRATRSRAGGHRGPCVLTQLPCCRAQSAGAAVRGRPVHAGEPQPGAAGQGSGPGPPATLLRPCLLGAVTWVYSHHREVSFFSAPQNRRREVSVVAENRRRGAAGTSPSAPASPSPAPRPPGGLAAGLLFHVAFHWGGTGDGGRGE